MYLECASECTWSTARATARLWDSRPGVVKQDKSSRGSVDTTKTCSDPQRVGICNGERPIGAAKGKQTKNHGLVPPHPPQRACLNFQAAEVRAVDRGWGSVVCWQVAGTRRGLEIKWQELLAGRRALCRNGSGCHLPS